MGPKSTYLEPEIPNEKFTWQDQYQPEITIINKKNILPLKKHTKYQLTIRYDDTAELPHLLLEFLTSMDQEQVKQVS